MKKIIFILISSLLCIPNNITTAKANGIVAKHETDSFALSINDCHLFCEGNSYIVDDIRYFSIRDIAEKLGLGIEWNADEKTISINTDSDIIFPYQNSSYNINVISDDLLGYKNYEGNIVIANQYYSASEMFCGLAKVQVCELNRYRYGYINKHGDIVIPCIYTEASDFNDGIALVSLDDSTCDTKMFFIDTNGRKFIDRDFYGGEVGGFNNGYAPIMKEGNPYPLPDDNIEKVWSYIDTDGELATELEFEKVYGFDDDGYAYVEKNNKWGMIDTEFRFVVDCVYDSYKEVSDFYNTKECGFGDFNISVDGLNKDISDALVVINDKTYLSAKDIGSLLGFTIKEDKTGYLLTLTFDKI